MSAAPEVDRRMVVRGALWTAAAVVAQSLWLVHHHPAAPLDADLLSYLAYYRDWRAGTPLPFGYTVPKVLPILLLGPLASPTLALAVSIGVAAAGGALIFSIGTRAFGLATGAIAALLYVVDPMRGVLTIRSSVDLYIGVALLAAILALQSRAVLWAGAMILVAALGKPLAAVCALAVLLAPGVPVRRRIAGFALPFLAVPATMLMAAALEGHSLGGALTAWSLPDQHRRFVGVAQGRPLGVLGSLELIGVQWFGGTLFARTWPLAAIGAALYLARGLRRPVPASGAGGDRRAPLLLVPALLAGAYLALAALDPIVLFTRFFWPLAIVLGVLAAWAAVFLCDHLPAPRPARLALLAVLVLALLADRRDDQAWRRRLALDPFDAHAAIADQAVTLLASDGRCAGPALVPLAYLPLAAWRAPGKLGRGELCAIEDWADGRGCADPNCVLLIPGAPTTARARDAVARLVAGGVRLEAGDENGALVRPLSAAGAHATSGRSPHGARLAGVAGIRTGP